MTLNPGKLLSYKIPEGRQNISPRDAALYALSIGMGQTPTDTKQLAFIDINNPLKVVPSMAFVLAHPGFWFADTETGIDTSGLLHADQSLELFAPLSSSGEITSTTRITDLVDKGRGKAALIQTETLLQTPAGGTLARLLRTVYLRGAGGFGGENKPPAPVAEPPNGSPDYIVEMPSRPEQALLYRLNGDLNPLHADPHFAKAAGFERPILHGLCTAGIVCHAILRAVLKYDANRLCSAPQGWSTGFVSPAVST